MSTKIKTNKSKKIDLRIKHLSPLDAIAKRRKNLQKLLNVNLDSINTPSCTCQSACSTNCESMIGYTQIPLGIAGPLKIAGSYAKGDFYLPLSTTEGALVASVARGAKASQISPIKTHLQDIGITRAPVFTTSSLSHSQSLVDFVNKNFSKISIITNSTSSHLTLKEIIPTILGRNVYLRFIFDTQDAMGMNMATIATEKATDFIEKNTSAVCIALSANLCVDKKPSWQNFILGRGKKVQAEITISQKTLKSIFKTNIDSLVELNYRKNLLGSALSGSLGFNAHYANIASAIFIATGQDPAHVVEAAQGITTVEKIDKNTLYFSVYLPNLIIGTVGGGTKLATQSTALQILNITPKTSHPTLTFAEIIASAILSGELSLLSALASKDLAKSHLLLARNNKLTNKT